MTGFIEGNELGLLKLVYTIQHVVKMPSLSGLSRLSLAGSSGGTCVQNNFTDRYFLERVGDETDKRVGTDDRSASSQAVRGFVGVA